MAIYWLRMHPKWTQSWSVPLGIKPSAESNTNGPEQPRLRYSIGVQHQGHASPGQRGGRCFSTPPKSHVSNNAEQDCTGDVGRAGQYQAEGFEIFQVIHAAS